MRELDEASDEAARAREIASMGFLSSSLAIYSYQRPVAPAVSRMASQKFPQAVLAFAWLPRVYYHAFYMTSRHRE